MHPGVGSAVTVSMFLIILCLHLCFIRKLDGAKRYSRHHIGKSRSDLQTQQAVGSIQAERSA